MNAIPLELFTLLGSSVLAGVMKVSSRAMEFRRQERLLTMEALAQRAKLVRQAREHENRGFAWTRRTIALTAVFFVIAFPKLVVVFLPEVPVTVGYTELRGGFFIFKAPTETIVWRELQGLILTPLDTHLLSAIVGLYFGGSLAR